MNDIVRPRWTDAIDDEWIRTLLSTGRATRERLVRTRDIMKRVLPDADVLGHEHRIAGLKFPDPGDRHVLAAAIEGGAETILTFHVRHFPADVLVGFRLTAKEPDAFACDLHDADPEAMLAVVDDAQTSAARRRTDRRSSRQSSVLRGRVPRGRRKRGIAKIWRQR